MGATRSTDGHGMPCPYFLGVESRDGGYTSVL